jgi:hypothetical protein
MAGGIFADQPFHFNIKCVIISIVFMILYWYLPYRNPFMLPIIFLVGYILIAWYDYLYDCNLTMYSGTNPISIATLDAWAKPQRRFDNSPIKGGPKMVENQEWMYKKKIYALHAIFIAPILFYVGKYGKKANSNIWDVMSSLSIITAVYHGLRIIYPRDITSCKEENNKERKQLSLVYLFHLAIIVPFLGYIGYNGANSDERIWKPLLGLSLFVFGYHGFRYHKPRYVKENC